MVPHEKINDCDYSCIIWYIGIIKVTNIHPLDICAQQQKLYANPKVSHLCHFDGKEQNKKTVKSKKATTVDQKPPVVLGHAQSACGHNHLHSKSEQVTSDSLSRTSPLMSLTKRWCTHLQLPSDSDGG